jgi:hypothetical protein
MAEHFDPLSRLALKYGTDKASARPLCSCHDEPMIWNKNRKLRNGGGWRCYVKLRENNQRWHAAHRSQRREWQHEYDQRRNDSPERMARGREHARTRRHGITREQRDALYERQAGKCAGCSAPFPDEELQIDHDHGCCPGKWSCGMCIRGLVCQSCNLKDVLADA